VGETSKEIEMELEQKLLCLRLALGLDYGQRGFEEAQKGRMAEWQAFAKRK